MSPITHMISKYLLAAFLKEITNLLKNLDVESDEFGFIVNYFKTKITLNNKFVIQAPSRDAK